jgi:hypothetical protein
MATMANHKSSLWAEFKSQKSLSQAKSTAAAAM